jgi:UDP-3-O-[3-hydroxymyristoyl] glucosamine N-acyltransferase
MGLTAEQLCANVAIAAPDLHWHIVKDNNAALVRFAPLVDANIGEIAFLANPKYSFQLATTSAQALVLNNATWELEQKIINCATVIVCDNPYAFFAFASQTLDAVKTIGIRSNIHFTAVIAASAIIGENVSIAAYVTIGEHAILGDNVIVGAHCSLGDGTKLGAATLLHDHVTVYYGVELGENCIVHSGAVIGSDGFGFAPYKKRWIKIPQTGTVIIGDDVEVGSNCSIDRGALGNTTIGRGTKLDNLIQIAHNVHVGEDCAFAASVAIAGSAVIGNRVQMGGKAGVLGHLSICDDVVISSCTLVTKTISKTGFYSGVYPIQENVDWEKNAVALKRLNGLRMQVRELEQAMKTIKMVE